MTQFALIFLFAACCCCHAMADVVVPKKTIRANSIITEMDVGLQVGSNPDVFSEMEDVIGQEARVNLYAGRPIFFENVGPPAIVERNQIVSLKLSTGALTITTEGRSLERGGIGDIIRIMNLSSRSTLFGQVQRDGTIKVQK